MLTVAASLPTVVKAENLWGYQVPLSSVSLQATNVSTRTNTTTSVFKLNAVPGGTSTLSYQTRTTPWSNTVVQVALDFKLSLDGTYYADTATSVTNVHSGGTNSVVINSLSATGARYAKLIGTRLAGTNSATVTVTLGSHLP